MTKAVFSVWVGGGEINSEYLTLEQAEELKKVWEAKGYDDVAIVGR